MTSPELLMLSVVEAWGRADMGPIRECLHDEIVWKSGSTVRGGCFVFGGVYRGRREALAHFAKLSTAYFFSGYEAKEVISSGEIVWGLFVARGLYRPTTSRDVEKQFEFETAFRFRVRDGKILEGQVFFDTLALLSQQGAIQMTGIRNQN